MNNINMIKQEKIYRKWEKYVATGEIIPEQDEDVRPLILDSWKRSRSYGVDPFAVKDNSHVACFA